ncbi:hypothetical protein ACHAXA_009579 [Cyclostephanos tholiformis]|uniref:Uncharacterized protein n=1 Tax=Cyclostephanos tholiformis TaxID=382380 RepID=A0ABD3SED8_9STRA
MSTAEEISPRASSSRDDETSTTSLEDDVASDSYHSTAIVTERMDPPSPSLRRSTPITSDGYYDVTMESDRVDENNMASRGESSSSPSNHDEGGEAYLGGPPVDRSSSSSRTAEAEGVSAQHRRLTDEDNKLPIRRDVVVPDDVSASIGRAIIKNMQRPEKKRTLVAYSGPTSLDRTIGKNDIYLTNFEYFIQHGIECHGLGGTDHDNDDHPFEDLNLQYVIVLTQEVANEYTKEDGLITRKQAHCRAAQQERQRMNNQVVGNDNSLITVLVREDRCYDMESLLLVARTYDLPSLYDHMVYINCGLAGPKFGPGSPEHWEFLSSWTELYTSLLSDKVQMVGHTINTHFNTVYSPHVQSFLFAVNTPMIDIWLKTGAIYECGLSNEDFKDDLVKMALVWRYEVGISRVLLERGYSIAAAFMHQKGSLGVPLIMDQNSTFGRYFDKDEIIHSDVFLEDGMRRLTESSFPDYEDHRKYAILPWDCYVFFKVSRLIPTDIQEVMQYKSLGPVALVPNDARRSSVGEWRRKAGVSILGDIIEGIIPRVTYTSSSGPLRCYGHHCEFEQTASATGELVGVFFIMITFFIWYVATSKVVKLRLSLALRQRKCHDK